MNATVRQPKYKVGDLVQHKLGFQVVITDVVTFQEIAYIEKTVTVRVGWPWKRYDKTKIVKVLNGVVMIFIGNYNGRFWVAGQNPTDFRFKEEELV